MNRRPVLRTLFVMAALSTLLGAAAAQAQIATLTLAVNKPSPQQVGTSMTFTATATGGSGSYEYKFWVARGAGAWVPVTPNYVPGRTMVWTPTAADVYNVRVYVRNVGSTEPKEKFAVVRNYYVVAQAPVTAVVLNANLVSPRQVGTPVTFTAVASVANVVGTHEYQFWLFSKLTGTYRLVKDYPVPGNSWTSTAEDMAVADTYTVKVNARNVGSIAPFEKYATKDFVMTSYVPLRPVSLSADKTSPQNLAAGAVTFTALALPGAPGDEVEYQFWLATGAGAPYVAVGDATTGYSAADTWHWTPAGAGSYTVMVYARTVGRAVAYERFRTMPFSISGLDMADCVACHGNPPSAGIDGGAGDDAPNVMGNGTSATGTGTSPKPFDDGTWGYNVNGHGANGTAATKFDTDFSGGVNTLNPNSACTACHELQSHHYDGVLDGVSGSAGTHYLNTYHLRTDLTFPYVNAADADTQQVQLRFDDACYRNCHQGIGLGRGTHGSNPAAGVVQFGHSGTVADGETLAWPVDSDITTRAGAGGTDYAPCSTCHDPHGTSIVEITPSNRMLRAKFRSANDLCMTCHL